MSRSPKIDEQNLYSKLVANPINVIGTLGLLRMRMTSIATQLYECIMYPYDRVTSMERELA
jgi:hypothetical protein